MSGPSPRSPKRRTALTALAVPDEGAKMALRGRRHEGAIVERFASRCELIRGGAQDDLLVARSSKVLHDHVDEVVHEVYRRLLAYPQTAVHFSSDATTGIEGKRLRSRVGERKAAFREWLLSVIDLPMDAKTAVYVASVGHAHVRPREAIGPQIKAGYLLVTMSWVQGLFIAILSDWCVDPVELGGHAAAWCRRLMMHLDLLLTVYGSTEGSAHWY